MGTQKLVQRIVLVFRIVPSLTGEIHNTETISRCPFLPTFPTPAVLVDVHSASLSLLPGSALTPDHSPVPSHRAMSGRRASELNASKLKLDLPPDRCTASNMAPVDAEADNHAVLVIEALYFLSGKS